MSTDRYILLPDHTHQECDDLFAWGKWIGESPLRRIGNDTLPNGVLISTIFLGLDHSFGMGGLPILYETMVFEKERPGIELHAERHTTWERAHRRHVWWVVYMKCLARRGEI